MKPVPHQVRKLFDERLRFILSSWNTQPKEGDSCFAIQKGRKKFCGFSKA